MHHRTRSPIEFGVCPFVPPFPDYEPLDQGAVAEHDRVIFEVRPGWSSFLREPFRVERERGLVKTGQLILVTQHAPGFRTRLPVLGRQVFGRGVAS